jgi:hypothetical protein
MHDANGMNVSISEQVQHRMRTLGISSKMVATALNAPDRVRHLPLSRQRSYFCAFDERTIRVLTTLDDCVIAVSWTEIGG